MARSDASPHNPCQNHLLAALPKEERARLLPHRELVPMRVGDTVCESGAPMRDVYFPTTAIVSLLYVTEDGASTEVAVVGNEGIVGVSPFLGGETTTSRAVEPPRVGGASANAIRWSNKEFDRLLPDAVGR